LAVNGDHPLDDCFFKRASFGTSGGIFRIDPKRFLDGGVPVFAARIAQIQKIPNNTIQDAQDSLSQGVQHLCG
jgi:hypothetical protein